VNDYQLSTRRHLANGQELPRTSHQNPTGISYRIENLEPHARQFTVFFDNVDPSFVSQPNRQSVNRPGRLDHLKSLQGVEGVNLSYPLHSKWFP